MIVLARTAALHNINTCVVGLDMQGDISIALGLDQNLEDSETLGDAFARASSVRGLADVFTGERSVEELVRPTDIPTLSYIPETPELTALDQSLISRNRREYWLREKIVAPLRKQFDLIVMDCSPNWSRLITNALMACDGLISPLECKINNFRNFKNFRLLMDEFRADLDADYRHVYVPTRLSPQRRLSLRYLRVVSSQYPGVRKHGNSRILAKRGGGCIPCLDSGTSADFGGGRGNS